MIRMCLVALVVSVSAGCASPQRAESMQLIYSANEFRTTLGARIKVTRAGAASAPFIVQADDVARAQARVLEAAPGPERVRALVESLSTDPPLGFGLEYDWLASSSARQTLASRRGNCVALASVLVGLGRGLGWTVYYAEARARQPETHADDEVTFVADHMVVVVADKTSQIVIDFTGQVDDHYQVRPIDDLTAYAHLVNNIAGQHIARVEGSATDEDWRIALAGFELAAHIEPKLARAWNNLGIALTRLGRFEEAQSAYERALGLDGYFGSTSRNLDILQTRATGKTRVSEEPDPH